MQTKTDSEKRLFAFWMASMITLFIFGIWLLNFISVFGREDNIAAKTKNEANPLSALIDVVKEAISSPEEIYQAE